MEAGESTALSFCAPKAHVLLLNEPAKYNILKERSGMINNMCQTSEKYKYHIIYHSEKMKTKHQTNKRH